MKTLYIAFKDTIITFRDRNALLLMIAAPLIIALVMGLAFGGSADDTTPISRIPVVVVNQDEGDLGVEFARIIENIEVNTADGEQPLFLVTEMSDLAAAQSRIETGDARGVIHVPPSFSAALLAGKGEEATEIKTTLIQVYTDPAAMISPGIIRDVVGRIATGFSTVVIGNVVAVNQVLEAATDIPLIFVNEDSGPLADAVNEAFSAENFAGLFVLTTSDDFASAQQRLDAGEVAAIIRIRTGFSDAVMTGAEGDTLTQQVDILGAEDSLSAPIVEDVVFAIVLGFGSDADPAASEQSPSAVLENLNDLEKILVAETASFGETEAARERISVATSAIGDGEGFNVLNYFVPSMAIFFLMFAVFDGTRSVLDEEREGTLHRLMTTPTPTGQIILGKIGGTFFSGILQFVVLVIISGLVFGVNWGQEPLGMALMVLATVSAATSLGAFVASFARNPNQAGVIGSAITLIFGILGGNFFDFRSIPSWLTPISKATINRWALEGFVNLAFVGQTLQEVSLNIIVLFGMAAVFLTLSILLFNRRFVA